MDSNVNLSRRELFRGKIRKDVLRLPWVISEKVFTDNCTQCQDCISVCETKIITKDEQGFPTIDFSLGECTFCNKCIDTCEQSLFINANERIKPWPITLQIKDNCLAKNDVYCQSCRDECEPSAISFSHFINGNTSVIPQPSINNDDCTQCGACLSTCPEQAIEHLFIKT